MDKVDQLEMLVDKLSVAGVLAQLGTICGEKAEHIRSNFNDKELARSWSHDGRLIDALAQKVLN